MSSKGYLAVWAGSALLATGILAGCDAGYEEEPVEPATEEESGNMAMYEPDASDPAADPTTADDPYATTDPARDPAADPAMQDPMMQDPMMGSDRTQQGTSSGQSLESMSSDQIVGKTVVSRDGEEIGDVQEVVQDPTSQQKFAVVDVGGFLGVGQKSIVIPFDELQVSSGDDRLQSDLTRETLQTETEYSPGDYEPVSDSGQSSGQETTQ